MLTLIISADDTETYYVADDIAQALALVVQAAGDDATISPVDVRDGDALSFRLRSCDGSTSLVTVTRANPPTCRINQLRRRSPRIVSAGHERTDHGDCTAS
jgi:hypothetical protein